MHLLLIDISGKTILIIMLIIAVIITVYGFLPLNKEYVVEEESYDNDENINTNITNEDIEKFKTKYNLQDDNDNIIEATNN